MRSSDLVAHPLPDQLAFELGKRQQHIERGPGKWAPRRSGAPIKRIVLYPGDRLFNESKIVVKQFLGSRTSIDRARDHPNCAWALNNLAVVYQDQGKYAQAEELYQRALAIREKALGAGHPDVALTLQL